MNRIGLGVVAVALSFGSLACSAESSESPRAEDETVATADGAQVIEADEAAGKLVVSVRRGDRAIRFELRLGPVMQAPPTAAELAANPELPTHEIDARILDAEGRPFHLQMGGDAFIDASWRMPTVEGVDATLRTSDYALARDAKAELATLRVPAALEELRRGALQLSTDLAHVADKPARTTETDPGTLTPKSGLYSGSSYTRYWDYYVAKKDISFTWGLANHSAVALRGWNSSYDLLFTAASCNHGTCATSMSRHCTMSGYRSDDGTHTRWFFREPSTSNGTVSGGCSTPYYWNSACGGHNCNDDSSLQGDAIYYDKWYDTDHGHCDACGANYWAPEPPGCN
jgi:hypothetical protein